VPEIRPLEPEQDSRVSGKLRRKAVALNCTTRKLAKAFPIAGNAFFFFRSARKSGVIAVKFEVL
jgi:hypothetical protein